MSREIKFRAWETTSKEMFYQVRCGGMFDNIATAPTTWNGSDWVHLTGGEFTEVMQYIGIVDKNGKEIYEGDIVNIDAFGAEEDGYFLVKFENESARYILSGDRLVYDFDNIYGNECEIIGNIYENPQLLVGEE